MSDYGPPGGPYKPANVEAALSMCREANLEATLPALMCWDLALYVKRLEDALSAARGESK